MTDLRNKALEPKSIKFDCNILDVEFHPSKPLLATAITYLLGQTKKSGVNFHMNLVFQLFSSQRMDSVRTLAGRVSTLQPCAGLFTGSSDKAIALHDLNGKEIWRVPDAHAEGVNTMLPYHDYMLATGDVAGTVKIWDTRAPTAVMEFSDNVDFISDFAIDDNNKFLMATSGDGTLSVLNVRRNRVEAQSEQLGDELLSCCIVKRGKKAICGSQEGFLNIFNWGEWGMYQDRFAGHPGSVESIVKIDEDTIITGASDGMLRIVNIAPSKLLGVLGIHADLPVEQLTVSHDKALLASASHDHYVKFWDLTFLYDEDDEDSDDDDHDSDDDDSDDDADKEGQDAAKGTTDASSAPAISKSAATPTENPSKRKATAGASSTASSDDEATSNTGEASAAAETTTASSAGQVKRKKMKAKKATPKGRDGFFEDL